MIHRSLRTVAGLLIVTISQSSVSDGFNYRYDERNRLHRVLLSTGESIEYSYDDVGNRLSLVTRLAEHNTNAPRILALTASPSVVPANGSAALSVDYRVPQGTSASVTWEVLGGYGTLSHRTSANTTFDPLPDGPSSVLVRATVSIGRSNWASDVIALKIN